MKSKYNVSIVLLAGLLVTLVISLCGNALAAIAPAVATLESIVDGLRTPLKMALDGDGNIYVADPRSGGVVELNKYGMVVKVMPTTVPVGSVALLNGNNTIPGGKLLVALGDSVAVLDQDGVEVAKLGSGAGQFVRVADMAVDPNGTIYVVDAGAYNVKVFTPAGTYLPASTFGGYGTANGKFVLPNSIAVISETVSGVASSRIAVVDGLAGKVIIFSSTGTFLQTIGSLGAPAPLKFSYPSGVAFEYVNGVASRMYVLDIFQAQIQVIDPVTKLFLSYVGSYGDKRGALLTPSDLQFDPINKRLLVANGMSNLVSFGIDGGQNPVNSVPPALVLNQPEISVSVPSVVLTGTVDIGCTLAASVNTAARISAASFPSAMSWMIPVDGLNPGANVVSITAKNGYGTTITKTATIQYNPPNAVFSIDGFPLLTSQPSVVLSGTVESGSIIYIANAANNLSGQAEVSSSGTWTYTLTLAEGINSIDVTAARSGSSPSFKSIAITLDTQAPVLTVAAMPDGSSTANQVQNISGTVFDPNLTGVVVNGIPVSVHNGVFSYAIALVKGDNVITVSAGDSLGHITNNTRTIVFDMEFPKITVSTPADGSFTNVIDARIAGNVDEAATVKVNGVVANPGGGLDWSASVRLSAGLNEINIEATDLAGLVANEIRTILYDPVAPNIAITSPSQDVAVKSPGLTIKGSVDDNAGIVLESITASVNGVAKLVTLVNGEFSLFADFTEEGTYAVAVTVGDAAGNFTTASRTIVYDVTPPMLTVDPINSTYPAMISGTVEAGATVVVKDAAGIFGAVAFAENTWTADLSGRTYDIATLAAEATDAAGNLSVARISVPVPDGDLNGDGRVTFEDANIVIKLVASKTKPTFQQLVHGDVGPLRNGKINPNGKLDMTDALLIQKKALGKISW